MKYLNKFPSIPAKQWKQQIQFELNGLDYNKTLLWKKNGINLKPFYTIEDSFGKSAVNIPNKKVKISEDTDIVSTYATTGKWNINKSADFTLLANKIKKGKKLTIDTRIYENAGANHIQQLAYAFSILHEYYTCFGKSIFKSIQFKLNTSSNFIFEIAKIEAAKYLWREFLEKYSEETADFEYEIYTTNRNKEGNQTDILRYSVEKFFMELNPDLFKGCFYIESLTKQLIEKTLELQETLIKSGGILKQLKLGTIQRKIKESSKKNSFDPKIVQNIRQTSIVPIHSIKQYYFELSELKFYEVGTYDTKALIKNYNDAAGFPPYLRGTRAKMLSQQWYPKNKSKDIISIKASSNIAETLLEGLEHIKRLSSKTTSKLVFEFEIEKDFILEIAKQRACRVLWANMTNEIIRKPLKINIHSYSTSNYKSTKTIQYISAIIAGTNSIDLEKELYDFLKNETYINKVIDPLGGSFSIENKTNELIKTNWEIISKKL